MDKEIIQKIAEQIVNDTIIHNWKFYILFILISVVSLSITHFLISYFKKRGESFATKADFNEIISQQEKLIRSTEDIRQEINHRIWKTREYNLIRRQKIEELYIALGEYKEWLKEEMFHRFFHQDKPKSENPYNKIVMLSGLYFPETKEALVTFIEASVHYDQWLVSGMKEVLEQEKRGLIKPAPSEEHTQLFDEKYRMVDKSISSFKKGLEELIENILT